MDQKKRYSVAVVGGAGTWGRKYMRAYAQHPDCDIVAMVDLARDRRQRFADHYGAKAVYDTVDELLAKEVPDIVSVVLPVAESPAAVIACAEAGVRAVSCEKPIAVSLEEADEMVRVCRELGTALGCGTAFWDARYVVEAVRWVRAGNIGRLTSAAIPLLGARNDSRGCEVSGAGCVELTLLRFLTDMDVEWVEGWTLPGDPAWWLPAGAEDWELDGGAYGRLGLSGGIICEIPEPGGRGRVPCLVSACGENGQVWIAGRKPVLVRGHGARSTPVHPEFLNAPRTRCVPSAVRRLLEAFDTGGEALCSGHDYRQALEIAIALKTSARRGHERVHLPLEDRSLRIFPQPYRLEGGDAVGWDRLGRPIPVPE
jgi:predicted dehydrogenase